MAREVSVDAGAWITITDTRDKHHQAASGLHKRLLKEQMVLLTKNLVIAEACIIAR